LTWTDNVPYTHLVHRLIVVLLGIALASTWGQASALHIHAYTDHDHPEHHHGLAVHQHETKSHQADSSSRLESCDPGRHTVPLVFLCASPPQAQASDSEFVSPAVPAPVPRLDGAIDITDVRVHGPPHLTQASPRAPPLSIPA